MLVKDFLDQTRDLPYDTPVVASCVAIDYPLKPSDYRACEIYADRPDLNVDILWNSSKTVDVTTLNDIQMEYQNVKDEAEFVHCQEDSSCYHPIKGYRIIDGTIILVL